MNDEGRREADVFYAAEREKLLAYIRHRGADVRDAEDIMAHSFLALCEHWGENIGDRRSYLRVTAQNEMYRIWRDRGRMPEVPLEDESCAVMADFAQQSTDKQALREALRKIPAREREAVVLRHWAGCDVAGAALKMGCAQGSVTFYTWYGLKKLRQLLPGEAEC